MARSMSKTTTEHDTSGICVRRLLPQNLHVALLRGVVPWHVLMPCPDDERGLRPSGWQEVLRSAEASEKKCLLQFLSDVGHPELAGVVPRYPVRVGRHA